MVIHIVISAAVLFKQTHVAPLPLSLENAHPFLDQILLQSLTREVATMGFVLKRKRGFCGLSSTAFISPIVVLWDWLVDEGEMGLKCWPGMSGADNHPQALNFKLDDGTKAVTDEIMCLYVSFSVSWFAFASLKN